MKNYGKIVREKNSTGEQNTVKKITEKSTRKKIYGKIVRKKKSTGKKEKKKKREKSKYEKNL